MNLSLTSSIRYTVGTVVGLAAAVVTWLAVASAHPIFSQLSPSGLVPSLVAGLVGGAITSLFAPRQKLMFAGLVGLAVAVALLAVLLTRGWYTGSRNPFLWYWPAYVLPTFLAGAVLTHRHWRSAA